MKKTLITIAIIIACAVSAYFNYPNLRTMHAFAEIKRGAEICRIWILRDLNWDVYYWGE